jgi:hypothetical protein
LFQKRKALKRELTNSNASKNQTSLLLNAKCLKEVNAVKETEHFSKYQNKKA